MAYNIPSYDPEHTSIIAQIGKLNALRKQNLENQYYVPINQANAMSKLAYSQYAQPEAAAKFLNIPGIQNMIGTENFKKLSERVNAGLDQPFIGSNVFGQQQPYGGGVLGALINYLSSGSQNPFSQGSASSATPQAAAGHPAIATGGAGADNEGLLDLTQGAAPNTPGARTARQSAQGEGLNTSPALANAETLQKANEKTVLGQTDAQIEQQKERSKIISNQAIAANKAEKILDAWYRNYKKSTYKGQYAGSRPASGEGSIPTLPGANASPEQLADNYGNQYLSVLSALGDTPAGKTDAGREILSGSKVNRALDEDAAKEAYESQKAGLHRMVNGRNFANDFYKNNPNATEEQLVAMMNAYDRYAPAYDYENGKPLPKNDKKYKDFTSRKALQALVQNGDYNPYEGKEKKSASKSAKPVEGKIQKTGKIGNKDYVMINGEWHEVGQ